jgi:predicted DsbA family dithiol-disulfide isomerase
MGGEADVSAGRPSPRVEQPDAGIETAGAPTRSGPPERPRVLVWFDYSCAFCYIDWFRFDRLSRSADVDVMDLPFELRPGIAEVGISASEHGMSHTPRVVTYLEKVAARDGVAFHEQDLVPNTHIALLLGEAARDVGEATHRALHLGIFDAAFGEGRDIGDRDVLLDVAEKAGMERWSAEAAWSDERFAQRVHALRHLAMAMGVTATPTALICNELIIGSRPAAVLEQSIERCLAGLSGRVGAAMGEPVEGAPEAGEGVDPDVIGEPLVTPAET